MTFSFRAQHLKLKTCAFHLLFLSCYGAVLKSTQFLRLLASRRPVTFFWITYLQKGAVYEHRGIRFPDVSQSDFGSLTPGSNFSGPTPPELRQGI
jgi:hypothetical protein